VARGFEREVEVPQSDIAFKVWSRAPTFWRKLRCEVPAPNKKGAGKSRFIILFLKCSLLRNIGRD